MNSVLHKGYCYWRLLLRIKQESLYPENNLQKRVPKDIVYIEKSIADSFQPSNHES